MVPRPPSLFFFRSFSYRLPISPCRYAALPRAEIHIVAATKTLACCSAAESMRELEALLWQEPLQDLIALARHFARQHHTLPRLTLFNSMDPCAKASSHHHRHHYHHRHHFHHHLHPECRQELQTCVAALVQKVDKDPVTLQVPLPPSPLQLLAHTYSFPGASGRRTARG